MAFKYEICRPLGCNVQPVKNKMKNPAFHFQYHHKNECKYFYGQNVNIVTILCLFCPIMCFFQTSEVLRVTLALPHSKKLLSLLQQNEGFKFTYLIWHIFDMPSGTVECKTLRQNTGGTKSRCCRLTGGNWSFSSYTCLN